MSWRDTQIAGSDLSSRARNGLINDGYRTAGELMSRTWGQLHRLPEVGSQTRREIIGWLVELIGGLAPDQ